ncbi:MAG: HAMP domain-containing protein [Calditrichaeota bacterium]|nr:MAG: HAMP domain-containing protein [Calditrichota bacterium]
MNLRTKLNLVVLFELIATVSIVGYFALQHSRQETESLSRELLRARTDYAFALCEGYYATDGVPTMELYNRIKAVHIFEEGYITVISMADSSMGELIIHPTGEGQIALDREKFPHVRAMIDEINAGGRHHGTDKFHEYHQGTSARGRQGEAKLGFYKYFAPWDWILLTSSYRADVYSSTDIIRQRIIEVILIVGILSLIFLNLTVQRILRPLQALINVTKKVAAGDLDASIEISTKDEIGGLATHFNEMLSGLKQNTRVWQELEIARRLQREMLPQGRPAVRGLEIEAKSLPATEVGGDFYDFIVLDEHRLGIVIGDVSGKGISGAMVMSSAMSALRFASDQYNDTDKILEFANRLLVRDIQRHMFVAVFFAIYDDRDATLHYTNAGQTMPILYKENTTEFLEQSEADRFPLGIRSEVNYYQNMIKLQPGELLVCYTDGIVELFNPERENYGFERFKASVMQHAQNPLPDLLSNLLADANDFVKDIPYSDDVTIVLIKVT